MPGALDDGPELTVVETEEEGGVREKWPGLDDEKAWLEKVEAERDFQVKQVLVVEVLENRGGPAVVEAIGRMAAKLDFLGLPVKRLALGSRGGVPIPSVPQVVSRQGHH